jgi:hypothetical protein
MKLLKCVFELELGYMTHDKRRREQEEKLAEKSTAKKTSMNRCSQTNKWDRKKSINMAWRRRCGEWKHGNVWMQFIDAYTFGTFLLQFIICGKASDGWVIKEEFKALNFHGICDKHKEV